VLSITTDNQVRTRNTSTRDFRFAPITQQNNTGVKTVPNSSGLITKDMGQVYHFLGGRENNITLQILTADCQYASITPAAGTNTANYLWIVLEGYKITGGANKQNVGDVL
jgi:hypothetical protein